MTAIDHAALRAAHAAVSYDDTIDYVNEGSAYSPLDRVTKECRVFYEAAHAAVPALLDENERLRKLVEEATGEVVTRKLGFLLRDYPDDKETRKLIERIAEIAKGAEG